jgi:homospermidine synthase
MITYKNKLLILGAGSVAQCVLEMLFELVNIDPGQITIIDAVHKEDRIAQALMKGVQYKIQRITKENFEIILSSYLRKGDFLLDLSTEIDSLDLINWCKNNEVLYVNTALEVWDDITSLEYKDLRDQTLYMRHIKLGQMIKDWPKNTPTAIVEHGANPGLVSHFIKKALLDIAKQQNNQTALEYYNKKDFASLSKILDIKTIHISEIDTQVSSKRKQVDEFVNTWSCDGLIEEAMAPAELGWGVHEKLIPPIGLEHNVGWKNQIFLKTRGLDSFVESWVPSGKIKGMVIRHGEAFSISQALSCYEKGKLTYRPTVHYAYVPCQDALASLKELEERNFVPQTKKRILNNEIIDGKDELGCLLMGPSFNAWWIGSILDIHESRKMAPNQNATVVQVAIGVIAAIIYAIENPILGVLVPDQLDFERILEIAKPYLGKFISIPSKYEIKNKEFQFNEFLIH